jgi:small subunit ribosomal protein S16
MTKPATIDLDRDRAYEWLAKGAQPTDTARAILRFKGVLYKKHLMRGVQKGALTEEQALAKWEKWVEDKESKIRKRREASEAEKHAHWEHVSGIIPKIVVKEEETVEEASETPEANEEVAAEETADTAAEAPATEGEAPAAEEAKSDEPTAKEESAEKPAETEEEKPAETAPAEEAKAEAPTADADKAAAPDSEPTAQEESKEEGDNKSKA